MAVARGNEDYPEEIDDQLTNFDASVSSVKTMLEKLMSIPRHEQPRKVGFFFFPHSENTLVLIIFTDILTHPQIASETYNRCWL